jgi:hypothetical protein
VVPGKVNPVLKEVAGTVNRYDIIDCQSLAIVGENKVDVGDKVVIVKARKVLRAFLGAVTSSALSE